MQLKDGGTGMSRRRKHADSPARRSTPHRAAAKNCRPAAEPWLRESRAACSSQLRRAGTRSARRAQRQAAADGGRSPRGEERAGSGAWRCRPGGRPGAAEPSPVNRAFSERLVVGGACAVDCVPETGHLRWLLLFSSLFCFAKRATSETVVCSRNLLGVTSG